MHLYMCGVHSRFSPQPHRLCPHRHQHPTSSLLPAAGSLKSPPSRTIAATPSSPSRAPSSQPPSVEPPNPQDPSPFPNSGGVLLLLSFFLGSDGVKVGGWGIERAARRLPRAHRPRRRLRHPPPLPRSVAGLGPPLAPPSFLPTAVTPSRGDESAAIDGAGLLGVRGERIEA
jgi:hypothetical protein